MCRAEAHQRLNDVWYNCTSFIAVFEMKLADVLRVLSCLHAYFVALASQYACCCAKPIGYLINASSELSASTSGWYIISIIQLILFGSTELDKFWLKWLIALCGGQFLAVFNARKLGRLLCLLLSADILNISSFCAYGAWGDVLHSWACTPVSQTFKMHCCCRLGYVVCTLRCACLTPSCFDHSLLTDCQSSCFRSL
jgi:hypothetical protein